MKEYKMLPIKRPEGVIPVKLPPPIPTIGPASPRRFARILSLSQDGNTAVVCENVRVLDGGQQTVRDVDVSVLGFRAVSVGDILAFEAHDIQFIHPLISHRHHQNHQHPKELVMVDEL